MYLINPEKLLFAHGGDLKYILERSGPQLQELGGQLLTQLLGHYVLNHTTSFLGLFSAYLPSIKLLPALLKIKDQIFFLKNNAFIKVKENMKYN